MRPQLKISLPKEGRLANAFNEIASIKYFRFSRDNDRSAFGIVEDNYSITNKTDWGLTCEMENYLRYKSFLPVEGVLEKQPDMFNSMENYGVDAAVMGVDKLLENTFQRRFRGLKPAFQITARYKKLESTPISRLMICGEEEITSPNDLKNTRIATSYPNILQEWLEGNDITNADILTKTSSVEDMIRRDAADYVCDVVETGGTLRAYGYSPYLEVRRVYPVLVEPLRSPKSGMEDFRDRMKLAVNPNAAIPDTSQYAIA